MGTISRVLWGHSFEGLSSVSPWETTTGHAAGQPESPGNRIWAVGRGKLGQEQSQKHKGTMLPHSHQSLSPSYPHGPWLSDLHTPKPLSGLTMPASLCLPFKLLPLRPTMQGWASWGGLQIPRSEL
jgi:hypothetical protein